jgi:hypothetical protein
MWQQCSQLSALDAAHHYGHLTFSWANHPEHWPVPFIGLGLILLGVVAPVKESK